MQKIIINFSGCKHIGEIHQIMKEGFAFPDGYGENTDALWDFLRNYCDYPLTVEIRGVSSLPRELNDYMKKVFAVFAEVQKDVPNIIFKQVSTGI